MVTQRGGRLASSPPVMLEKGVAIKRDAPLHQVRDGPGPRLGQAGQRLALAVCVRYAGALCLARRMVAEEQPRRLGEGPRERRLTDRRAGSASPRPRRCLGTRAQAAVGHNSLPAGAALAGLDVIHQHQAQHRTEARDGA